MEQVYDFLELSRSASSYYKRGTLEQKRRISQIVFLELNVKGKRLDSYKLKEVFEPLDKRCIAYGGPDGARTRNLHSDSVTPRRDKCGVF